VVETRGESHRRPLLTRRELLQGGVVAGIGLAAWPLLGRVPGAASSPRLEKYVDPLPIPGVIRPARLVDGIPQYRVEMTRFRQKVHRDLPPTTLWGYNGGWPGPTFEARTGRPIEVLWVNDLPATHLLEPAYDETLCGADLAEPHSRAVVHLHGARVMPDSDGYPEAWFTRNWAQTGPFFISKASRYPNDQAAAQLWYHDHAMGITRLNTYAGLTGLYVIRDAVEDDLALPRGAYEVPLVIQDRMFHPDGSLFYPTVLGGSHDVWAPEFFGDVACVNGAAFPFLEVEPRRYRFRVVNGSNCRYYNLTLADAAGQAGPAFHQIGTDSGFLPAPVTLTALLIGPGERADVVLDLGGAQGKVFTLRNDAEAPFEEGGAVALPEIMQLRVTKRLAGKDTSLLPASLVPVPLLAESRAVRQRTIMLSHTGRPSDGFPVIVQLGGSPLQATAANPRGGAYWHDAVTETPRAGTVEIWNLVNLTTEAHPIHLHLVKFQVLDRRGLDLQHFLAAGEVRFSGRPIPPAPNERPAWKDTVSAFSAVDRWGGVQGLVTRIIARFDLPTGARVPPGARFRYVYHCHLLEHEDNEMMRPFDVVA
jgi:spore coat protein A